MGDGEGKKTGKMKNTLPMNSDGEKETGGGKCERGNGAQKLAFRGKGTQ